jgi:hypothetical protein
VFDDLYIFLNRLMLIYVIKKETTGQEFDWNSDPPPVMLAHGYHPQWGKIS